MSHLTIPFGKHKGALIVDLPSSYLRWLRDECDNDEIQAAAEAEYKWRDDHSAHQED